MEYADFESRKKRIEQLIGEAEGLLEEARELSDGLFDEGATRSWQAKPSFNFDGPAYGMGGSLKDGEWFASSQSC